MTNEEHERLCEYKSEIDLLCREIDELKEEKKVLRKVIIYLLAKDAVKVNASHEDSDTLQKIIEELHGEAI